MYKRGISIFLFLPPLKLNEHVAKSHVYMVEGEFGGGSVGTWNMYTLFFHVHAKLQTIRRPRILILILHVIFISNYGDPEEARERA